MTRGSYRRVPRTMKLVFKDAVIDEFADSYRGGQRRLPLHSLHEAGQCFRICWKTAKDLDAACMANGPLQSNARWAPTGPKLHCAADAKTRDQKLLFCSRTTPEQLRLFCAFPWAPSSKNTTHERFAAKYRPSAVCARTNRTADILLLVQIGDYASGDCRNFKACAGPRKRRRKSRCRCRSPRGHM